MAPEPRAKRLRTPNRDGCAHYSVWVRAGAPAEAQGVYEAAVEAFRATGIPVQTGVFQAHMQVSSQNDGPVTILLDSRRLF